MIRGGGWVLSGLDNPTDEVLTAGLADGGVVGVGDNNVGVFPEMYEVSQFIVVIVITIVERGTPGI